MIPIRANVLIENYWLKKELEVKLDTAGTFAKKIKI